MVAGKRAPEDHQTAVGTSAAVLEGTQYPGFILQNQSNEVIYLGDSAVATTTGFAIGPGEIFSPPDWWHKALRGQNEQRLYGIAGTASNDVVVLVGPFAQA